eukprot:6214500-Pleurochrysis_carterae.AAC.5
METEGTEKLVVTFEYEEALKDDDQAELQRHAEPGARKARRRAESRCLPCSALLSVHSCIGSKHASPKDPVEQHRSASAPLGCKLLSQVSNWRFVRAAGIADYLTSGINASNHYTIDFSQGLRAGHIWRHSALSNPTLRAPVVKGALVGLKYQCCSQVDHAEKAANVDRNR